MHVGSVKVIHTVVFSASMVMRSRLVVKGIPLLLFSFCQFFSSSFRYSWLNGPQYDRNPVAISTSPTNLK